MLKEFKEFIMRGNVVDMAVGIIIGSAFGAIIKSLVDDILMPPIGLLLGRVDFANLYWVLKPGSENPPYESLAQAQEVGTVTVNYGIFINTLIAFIIVALAVFLLIKTINNLRRGEKAPPAEPTTKKCPFCLSDIAIEATRCAFCTSEV